MLVESGFTLWEGALHDPQYKGLTAEQIYDKRAPEPDPEPEDEEEEKKEDEEEGDGDNADPGDMPGAVFDAPEPGQDEAEWQVAVKQAIQVAKMMGELPAGIASAVEAATTPKVDWKSILRRFVQQCAMADYSWKLPNRRYIAQGIYLPELRSESMPPLVVFLDTSGSTQPYMAGFIGEIRGIAEECQPECVYIVHCDAAVHLVEKYERGEDIGEIVPQGLGGTSFIPAFEWAEREQIQPACAIYLTDLDGTFPTQPPAYPVLWAASEPGHAPCPG